MGELPLTRPDGGAFEDGADQRDEEPVLPAGSPDERDVGWGDDPSDARRGRDFYQAERPPHHE